MAHAAAADSLARRWRVRYRAIVHPREPQAALPFPELVHVHRLWRKALEADAPDLEARSTQYRRARAAFERAHGKIIGEYWCWHVPSAVVLTAARRPPVLRWVWRPKLAFHRASDWATRDHPEIAAELHRCDELAVRSSQVLTGLRQRICLQLVMAAASHLLTLVDARTARGKSVAVLDQERTDLVEAEKYYCNAANGQAQLVYFAGMAVVAAALCTLALVGFFWVGLGTLDEREFYGCLAAGALGAVVSVIQRINSGLFNLEYDVGRFYLAFLGGLRPMIGGGFGLIFYFAAYSGVLNIFNIQKDTGTEELFALLVLAFLAGFSERWAQDTLTSLPQGSAAKPAPEQAHGQSQGAQLPAGLSSDRPTDPLA